MYNTPVVLRTRVSCPLLNILQCYQQITEKVQYALEQRSHFEFRKQAFAQSSAQFCKLHSS